MCSVVDTVLPLETTKVGRTLCPYMKFPGLFILLGLELVFPMAFVSSSLFEFAVSMSVPIVSSVSFPSSRSERLV